MHNHELFESYRNEVSLMLYRAIRQEAKDIVEIFFELF